MTSDRELAAYVRQCGAQVVRSGEFRRRLDEEASTSEGAKAVPDARAGVAASDLGEWMSYFGVAPEDDEEPPAEVSVRRSSRGEKEALRVEDECMMKEHESNCSAMNESREPMGRCVCLFSSSFRLS